MSPPERLGYPSEHLTTDHPPACPAQGTATV